MIHSGSLQINSKQHLKIGGCDTVDLAAEYGTPLYVMDEGLIKNASISRGGIGNKAQAVFLNNARVTLKGLDYLQDNSALVKTYKGLKEIRDWLPF